jgi:hypothetical protein
VAGLVYLRPTNFHVFQRYIEIAHVRTYPDQLYYLKRASIFVGPLVGVLLVPLFLASTVQLKEKNKLLFLWFFVPLLIYSVSPSKTVRQLIPLLPALAVMLAGTLGGHRWFKKMRDSYVFLVISLAILQYACVNANIFYKESCQSPSTMDGGLLSVRKNSQLSAAKRLLSFFQKEVGTSKDARNVCFLFHYPGVYDFLRLSASFDELPLQIKCPLEGDEAAFRRDYGDLAQMDWSRVIAGMDYIIDKTGVTCGDPGPDERVISRGLQESFARHKNEFTRIAEFEFYGDRIRVYKKSSVSTRVD